MIGGPIMNDARARPRRSAHTARSVKVNVAPFWPPTVIVNRYILPLKEVHLCVPRSGVFGGNFKAEEDETAAPAQREMGREAERGEPLPEEEA